mmetsp:Transcript_18934/g.52141  ORF Transcript_18934/g.52141 Transcript_18934/m.52141 type:complete len:242 (+) Transcript_18934:694-1419(+)
MLADTLPSPKLVEHGAGPRHDGDDECDSAWRVDQAPFPVQSEVFDVIGDLEGAEAQLCPPKHEVARQRQTHSPTCVGNLDNAGHIAPRRHGVAMPCDGRGAVVEPLQVDELLLRARQLAVVSVKLFLNRPAHADPKADRDQHGQGEHEVPRTEPHLAVVAVLGLQPLHEKATSESQRGDRSDYRDGPQKALHQGDPQHACNDRHRPIGPTTQDHDLAEGQPRLLEHSLNGAHEGLVHTDSL